MNLTRYNPLKCLSRSIILDLARPLRMHFLMEGLLQPFLMVLYKVNMLKTHFIV
ncbi:hypothetical protein Hanom_Chr08g00745171 [Helianthus anomalus]